MIKDRQKSPRKVNFGAGPAMLPEEVLAEASEAMCSFPESGMSVLEIPHRGKHFRAILEEAEDLVRELCGISSDYHVFWLQGGRLQFAMVPMNFLDHTSSAGYIDTGHWSGEAAAYARHYGAVEMVSSGKSSSYRRLPEWPGLPAHSLAYLHCTTNNTIYGTQWPVIPAGHVPLIADMSSDIFSMKRDYHHCAMFYAVAQKNLGAAGNTLVVMHKDLLQRQVRDLPPILCYAAYAAERSLVNTPPVFTIYVSLLMLRWIKSRTIAALEQENREKASLLYREIDRNTLFCPAVEDAASRSLMNVCFRLADPGGEQAFIDICEQNHIAGIAGHRSVGGFRASLYNAVTKDQVTALVAVMQAFEENNLK